MSHYDGEEYEVRMEQVKTPEYFWRESTNQLFTLLCSLGCTIAGEKITFPEGTVRTFKIRITTSDHYIITLPDGTTLKEVYSFTTENSLLFQLEDSNPTFKYINDRHELHLANLAHKAGVAPRAIYAMLEGIPIPASEAVKVLAAVSDQTGIEYNLQNVTVKIRPEHKEEGS